MRDSKNSIVGWKLDGDGRRKLLKHFPAHWPDGGRA
jgi:hypothetical protein